MLLGERENGVGDMFIGSIVRPEASAIPVSIDQTQSLMDLLGLDMNNSPDLSLLSLKKIKKKAQDLVEKEVIALVLDKTAWNRSKTARILKISYKSLLNKIKDLNLNPPSGSDF
jgi:DNA-binding NtrC family response regulator